MGVGILQSVGKASDYYKIVPVNKIIPISYLTDYVEYDKEYKLNKVFESLKEQGMHPPFYYLLLHYVMLSITGLYTIYHYIFIISAQALFVFLSLEKKKKNISNLLIIYLIIIASFLPWVNSLMHHLKVVTAENYYYTGYNNLLLIILEFLKVNFLQFREILQISLKNPLIISIALIIGAVFCLGVIRFPDSRLPKHFFISVMGYFIVYFFGDLIMKQNTLSLEKF
jgi:hypothetical protein